MQASAAPHRQPHAINDRSVVQRVREDVAVAATRECADGARVGREARRKQQRCFLACGETDASAEQLCTKETDN